MPHKKIVGEFPEKGLTGRLDELNVERFTYKKDSVDDKKQTEMRVSPYDKNGYRKSLVKEEGKTPFQKLLGI